MAGSLLIFIKPYVSHCTVDIEVFVYAGSMSFSKCD